MADGTTDNSGVGNFKGVMLCNRPFAGTFEQPEVTRNEKKYFLSGIVPEPLGICKVPKPLGEAKRAPLPALVRHRKWLADLQKARTMMKEKETAEETKDTKGSDYFTKREAALRKKVRETIIEASKSAEEEAVIDNTIKSLIKEVNEEEEGKKQLFEETKTNETKQQIPTIQLEETKEYEQTVKVETNNNNNETQTVKIDKNKPKWAYTEEDINKVQEEEKVEELNDLLDFVNTLDYDKYIEDLELRTALTKVKDRIEELSKPTLREGGGDDTIGVVPQTIETLHMNNNNNNNNSEYKNGNDYNDDDDYKSVCSMLSEEKRLGDIHSKQSLKVRVDQVKNEKTKLMTPIEEEKEEYQGPKIIQIDEEGGSRISKKNYPANLPYLHRNPAV